MSRPKKLPSSLRRAANRPGSPGPLDDRLVEAARHGILTRRNTQRGTAGARAVYFVEIENRLRKVPAAARTPGWKQRALGHETPAERQNIEMSTWLDTPSGFTVVHAPTRADRNRIGRYNSLVGKLASGEVTPEAFRRRIESWEPIQGKQWLSDPARVLAIMAARLAAELPIFIYEGRPS